MTVESEDQNRDAVQDRRRFFRKLVAVAAVTGISGSLLAKLAEPVSAASSGEVAFYTGSSTQSGDPNFYWDNVNKRLGIATEAPENMVHIDGSATADVFCGIGPHPNTQVGGVYTGPAMNFGYSGNSFGEGSGFFNVRPDPSATAPNPSLRFMTNNVQAMIITNSQLVGIGTSSPAQMLTVAGDVGQSVVAANGLVKAAALVDGSTPTIIRSFNNLPGGSGPTVSQTLGPGTYEVDFGVNVAQRFFCATLLSSNSTDPGGASDGQVLVSTADGNADAVFVRTNDSTGTSTNSSFYLMIM
jgi:hypothetical protein